MTYYSILKKINNEICNNDSQIRDNTSINIINNAIEEAINSQDEETLIKAMKVAALIKLFQPFYDGNHRTALIIFGNIISQKGYTFDYQTALNDMKNKKLNIPTIYSENDKIGNFDKWLNYIQKENKIKL